MADVRAYVRTYTCAYACAGAKVSDIKALPLDMELHGGMI